MDKGTNKEEGLRCLEFGSCHALHESIQFSDHDDTSAPSVPQFRTATRIGAGGFGMLIGSSPWSALSQSGLGDLSYSPC